VATLDTTAAPTASANRLQRLRVAPAAAAISACLPYAALKVAWLTGSSVGSATALGAASLHDGRHSVGNVVTLAMELVAVLLALALSDRRGQKLPAAVVLIPVWAGTGLLAPVALGLPLGIVAQAIVGGSPVPADNGLHGWVYAVVYGGFIVQAVALLTAFVLYARVRWGRAVGFGCWSQRLAPRHGFSPEPVGLRRSYTRSQTSRRPLPASHWQPANLDMAAQKSLLVSTGLLALAGASAVRRLAHPRSSRRLPKQMACGRRSV
jgi:hypothetical protein